VLALAIKARADLIVSGDRDILDLQRFQDIAIVTPAEALRKTQAQV
jgi:predicted nucleic acid-binding protein